MGHRGHNTRTTADGAPLQKLEDAFKSISPKIKGIVQARVKSNRLEIDVWNEVSRDAQRTQSNCVQYREWQGRLMEIRRYTFDGRSELERNVTPLMVRLLSRTPGYESYEPKDFVRAAKKGQLPKPKTQRAYQDAMLQYA